MCICRQVSSRGKDERKRERETPSLSLRLRSVRYARADSDVLRTISNRVRARSACVPNVCESNPDDSQTTVVETHGTFNKRSRY